VSGHILVVDGDQISRLMLRHMLAELGYETSEAYDVASALDSLAKADHFAVISDLLLPDGTGLDVLDAVDSLPEPPPFVLVTDVAERDDSTDLRLREVPLYLTKPVSTAELENSLRTVARSGS
jgi:CheY-like chemotaxis protein